MRNKALWVTRPRERERSRTWCFKISWPSNLMSGRNKWSEDSKRDGLREMEREREKGREDQEEKDLLHLLDQIIFVLVTRGALRQWERMDTIAASNTWHIYSLEGVKRRLIETETFQRVQREIDRQSDDEDKPSWWPSPPLTQSVCESERERERSARGVLIWTSSTRISCERAMSF